MELKEIKEIIDLVSEKGFTEFELEKRDFKLKICSPSSQPQKASTTRQVEIVKQEALPAVVDIQEPKVTIQKEVKVEKALHKINSPIVGTFYRAPSPTADPFVKVGSQVKPGSVLCIIEAMKLMNEIESDVAGEIVEIYVENGQPVEYGQSLFGVKVN